MLTLQEICEATGGKLLGSPQQDSIDSFHFDTRMITPGSMFIALTGGARDGHLFLEKAKEQGAIAALISNPDYAKLSSSDIAYVLVPDTQQGFAQIAQYYRKKLTIPMIAVTGSNGKTTTKDMISHVLSYKKKVFKTYKNYNNHLGVPLSLLQIKPDDEMAVLEMGMNHAGEIDYLANIVKPDVSVIINVTDAHIEHLGSRENIAKAKAELLPHTSPAGFAILNGDNPYVREVSSMYPGKTYFYRLHDEADIYATDIRTNDRGTSFSVHYQGQSIDCSIPMFGVHNVSNALPAIFIALQYGYSLKDIKNALVTLSISPMRFELVRDVGNCIIINDAYNASPTSMKSSIETFGGILPQYKKVLILGDMFELGDKSEAYHKEIGRFIDAQEQEFEFLATVGTASKNISDEAGIPSRHFTDKKEAALFLTNYANPEHALLFKASRGMKLEELIQEIKEAIVKP